MQKEVRHRVVLLPAPNERLRVHCRSNQIPNSPILGEWELGEGGCTQSYHHGGLENSRANSQINLSSKTQDPITVRELRLGNWDLVLKLIWELGRGTFVALPSPHRWGRESKTALHSPILPAHHQSLESSSCCARAATRPAESASCSTANTVAPDPLMSAH